jgi:hypothetical protein
MLYGSPLAVVFPWKNDPYQEAVPTWYGLLVCLRVVVAAFAATGVAATGTRDSELLGLSAAPAPRLATDNMIASP